MGFDWRGAISAIAPGLGGAIGGPAGAIAAKMISSALLGKDRGSSSELAAAMASATPDQLLALKKADQEFAEFLAKLDVDFEKIAAEDRASARAMQVQTRSWVPGVLAVAVTVGFFGLIAVMCTMTVPAANRDTLNILLGSLGTAWVTIVTFFFGSSSSSRAKDDTISKLATS
jgi:hypothetical protein